MLRHRTAEPIDPRGGPPEPLRETPLGIGFISLYRFFPKGGFPLTVSKPRLRAVSAGEKAVPVAPMTVSEAADKGSTRDLLVAMRARIAKAVGDADTPARDLAALTKRLVEVVRDIEAIDARTEEAESHAHVEDGKFEASAI